MVQTEEKSLTISRVFKISQEELWEICTDEKKIAQWHRPNMTDFVTTATSSTTVGGAYRFSMKKENLYYTAFGIYKEVSKPHRLVFSWQWENDPSGEISEVRIDLKPVEGGTELILTHAALSGPESVQAHLAGWLGCVENIEILFS